MSAKDRLFPWGHARRFNDYAHYQKRRFGERVQKVTVDAGFTCPNRDGTVAWGGCIYCNNESFNPRYNSPIKSVRRQIEEGIPFLKKRYGVRKFIVYFQPYSNTYAPLETLKRYYEEALMHPDVIGLAIGTRPDCVDEAKISYLQELATEYDITIEYGLESISDQTLKRINRGHDYSCFLDALALTRDRGIHICCHIILGFPWEHETLWLQTADTLSSLPIDFLKIHQLHVVQGTPLGNQYLREPFALLSLDEYLTIVTAFLEHLNPAITIQRLFGQAPPDLLIAPKWETSAAELLQMLEQRLREKDTWQGKMFDKV